MSPPAHRHDDPPDSREPDKRAFCQCAGISRGEWNDLHELVSTMNLNLQTHLVSCEARDRTICEIDKALFGARKDGINNDGGIVAEVRTLRDNRQRDAERMTKISGLAWTAVGTAVTAGITAIWNAITGGKGP